MIRAIFAAVLLSALLALFVRCVANPAPLPELAQHATQGIPDQPPVAYLTLDGDRAEVQKGRFGPAGRYRVLHGGSACANATGHGAPLVWPDRSAPPTVGVPTRVQWTSTPTAPFIDTPQAVLLLSFGRREPVLLTSAGFPGCLLHVDPSPRNLFAVVPKQGSEVTHDGGQVWLHWTPPSAFAGIELVAQLVLASPEANQGGWLFSPGLEMWIGSGQ